MQSFHLYSGDAVEKDMKEKIRMFGSSNQRFRRNLVFSSSSFLIFLHFVCLLLSWDTVESQAALTGEPCVLNPCFYSDMCIANAPVSAGGGSVCRCRLSHAFPNMTYKANFTACTPNFGPWGTYPIENGAPVSPPAFEYERLPDRSFTSDGHYQEFHPHYARIHTNEKSKGAWCALTDNNPHWLQVDLGAKNKVIAVGTQARAGVTVVLSVKTYKISISDDNTTGWTVIQESGVDRIFPGNTDKSTEVINFFDPVIETNYIRFLPEEYISLRCMRVEIYGEKLIDECSNGWNQCDAKATCTDTLASYMCTCPVGYYDILGNGFVCLQVNECVNRRPEFRHNCSQYASCEDTDGAFTCTCFTGK